MDANTINRYGHITTTDGNTYAVYTNPDDGCAYIAPVIYANPDGYSYTAIYYAPPADSLHLLPEQDGAGHQQRHDTSGSVGDVRAGMA